MSEANMRMQQLRPADNALSPDEKRAHHRGEFERVFPEGEKYVEEFTEWGPNQIVIKLGGAMVENQAVLNGLVVMQAHGLNPVVIHGGGPQIDEALKAAGEDIEKTGGVRRTPPRQMPIIERELNGINDYIVENIESLGGRAVGVKRGVFEGLSKAADDVVLDRVSRVNAEIVTRETRAGSIAVVSCMGNIPGGASANVNGDTAVGAFAEEVKPKKLLLVTESGGVIGGEHGRIPQLSPGFAQRLIDQEVIKGGMLKKVKEADYLVSKGIGQVVMTRDFMRELFTDLGEGTIYHL